MKACLGAACSILCPWWVHVMKSKQVQLAGWVAAGCSTLITCAWAIWGIIENFHEGWFHDTLVSNLGLMLVQYLSPMMVFLGLALISISYPRLGGVLHLLAALMVALFFRVLTNTVALLLVLPLGGIGVLYWFGRPQPRKLAQAVTVGFPILALVAFGAGPAFRVSIRTDDGNLNTREVSGNGVTLVWAPDGPGWPRVGSDWFEAQRACQHLSQDGLTRESNPTQIWRLPTVDEVVRSMTLHGENSRGVWDAQLAEASYATTPDKESPLWNVHSQVIYWWTATSVDDEHAFMIAYDGNVWSRIKSFGPDYLGFRCVR
jgi:hypothetical protein